MENYIFLILLFSFINSFAGTLTSFQDSSLMVSADTTLADIFFERATKFYKEAKYDSAKVYFEKSSIIFIEKKLLRKGIHSLNMCASASWRSGKYDLGKEYLTKTLKIAKMNSFEKQPVIADSYEILGTIYIIQSKLDSAEIYINKSLELKILNFGNEHIRLNSIYDKLGSLSRYKGYYDEAIEFHRNSLRISLMNFPANHRSVAVAYSNIANSYSDEGDFELALIYLKKALNIYEQNKENNYDMAITFSNIALNYFQIGDYEKSLFYNYNSIDIWTNEIVTKNIYLASNYYNIAEVNRKEKNYLIALQNYEKVIELSRELFGEKHKMISMAYTRMGEVHKSLGDNGKAYEFQNKALLDNIKLYGYKHPDVTTCLIGIGNIYRENGNLDSASHYYQNAIESSINNFGNTALYSDLKLKEVISPIHLLESLVLKAETFYLLYSKNSTNNSNIENALDTYLLALDLLEKMRMELQTESSKILLSDNYFGFFEKATNVALELYRQTKNQTYIEFAFKFSESNKANILHQSIFDSKAKLFSGIPDNLIKKEKELRVDLAFYNTELNKEKQKKDEAKDSSKIMRFEDNSFDLNIEYQELLSRFEKEYPKYYNMKYKNEVISVKDIQQRLDDYEVLLEYFVGDSTLFIFTIDKNNYDVYSGTSPENSTIKKLINSIYNQDTDKYLESSYALYKKLIEPVEEKIKGKKVLLIPDGMLHYVPFDALLTEQVEKNARGDYSSLPYLINDYNIRFGYSASMAFNEIVNYKLKLAEGGAESEGFIGFAPVFADTTIEVDLVRREISIVDTFNKDIYRSIKRSLLIEEGIINPLPASEEEIKNIYEIFKNNNKPAEIYLHSTATEDLIKSEKVNKFKYVHLATHAFMNEKNPKLSGIVLTSDSLKEEDGVLYSEEIYNLDLNADLVVLSACESGLGEIVRGEGIIGFTRGLVFSGAKNIIVSLWNVLDESTAKLMTKLYKKILGGKSYADALRQSKLETIKENIDSPPRYWAPFILVGN